MKWLPQNQFLSVYLLGVTGAFLLCGVFLFREKAAARMGRERLEDLQRRQMQLRQAVSFPIETNCRTMKAQIESLRVSLAGLEAALRPLQFPVNSIQPDEFQTQLRKAMTSLSDRARENKVRLPENFFLGFDQYAASLPKSEAAPLLGWELDGIEWLLRTLVDAPVDSIGSLVRAPLPEEQVVHSEQPANAPSRATKMIKARGLPVVEPFVVALSFSASPATACKVLNQIASAHDQFFILRTLIVRNQVMKGPAREDSDTVKPRSGADKLRMQLSGQTTAAPGPSIRFIVGTEHIEVAAQVEIVRFNLPQTDIHSP